MSHTPTHVSNRTAWMDEDTSDQRSAMENALEALNDAAEETISDRISGSDRAVFTLSVDVNDGENGSTPSLRAISPHANNQTNAKDAGAFAVRSIRLACMMALIGALVVVLPLGVTAYEGGRKMTENVWELTESDDPSSSSDSGAATNSTTFIWLRASSLDPTTWSNIQREKLDEPMVVVLPFWALAYASSVSAFVLTIWLTVRSWYASESTRSSTFSAIAAGGALVSWSIALARQWLSVQGALDPQGELALAVASLTVGALAVGFVFVLPAKRPWNELVNPFYQDGLLTLLLAAVVGETLLRMNLAAYFASETTLSRLLHRCVFLPVIKYVWVHMALAFALRCEVTYNATVFLLLVLPVAMATASGHVMQLSADSIPMACLMQLLYSIEAMLECRLCMVGLSHVDWAFSLVSTICFHKSGSRARGATVADLGDVHFEATGPSPERLAALTNVAVCFGPIEGASSTMTAFLFLVLPLNPFVPGGARIQPMNTLLLWLIPLLFELVLPQVLIAYWDQNVSRKWQGLFRSMIQSMKNSFDLKTSIVLTFITISCVACVLFAFVATLCPAPDPETGKSLHSFSACCSDRTRMCGRMVGD